MEVRLRNTTQGSNWSGSFTNLKAFLYRRHQSLMILNQHTHCRSVIRDARQFALWLISMGFPVMTTLLRMTRYFDFFSRRAVIQQPDVGTWRCCLNLSLLLLLHLAVTLKMWATCSLRNMSTFSLHLSLRYQPQIKPYSLKPTKT